MTNLNKPKPVEILLVEDSPSDIELTQEGLKNSKIIHNLHVVTDGEQALNFLNNRGQWESAPKPDMILLDLNLPRKGGKEVLEEVKRDQALKHIPVIVLTTSQAEQDVLKSYQLHANCYITKPLDVDQFFDVLKSLENFWFSIVKLPSGAKQ